MRKHRDIKLVTTERRRNYLVLEPNFHTTKFFTENLIAKKKKKKKNNYESAGLVLSILEFSKILMHEFWYEFAKPKYDEKAKLCYMDTDSFLVYIKTWYL